MLDADVWGYSIPRMLGLGGQRPKVSGERKILPLESHGIKVMSIGFFLAEDEAVVWRGPMLHKALTQFLEDVNWGELDFLLIDLPPGTGDVSMTLAQLLPEAKFLIVTTPQEAAQKVARRSAEMADKVKLEIGGVIENMSGFTTPGGERFPIFGEGGGQLAGRRARGAAARQGAAHDAAARDRRRRRAAGRGRPRRPGGAGDPPGRPRDRGHDAGVAAGAGRPGAAGARGHVVCPWPASARVRIRSTSPRSTRGATARSTCGPATPSGSRRTRTRSRTRWTSRCWTSCRASSGRGRAADLGCGTGRTAAWLRAHGVDRIDGVDLTPEMLDVARERGAHDTLREGDVADTGLESGAYDLVVASLVDEHLPRSAPLYGEAWRLARPGGAFVLVCFHPHFIMATGMPTHFTGASGEPLAIATHVHLLSDHVTAGLRGGLDARRAARGRDRRPLDRGQAQVGALPPPPDLGRLRVAPPA